MATKNRKWPAVALGIFVIVAGAGVGGFFGIGAGDLYNPASRSDGERLGALAGGVVGLIWTLVMLRVIRNAHPALIVVLGTVLGLAAGVVATLSLHTALAAINGARPDLTYIRIGIGFGLTAGLVTGLVCGFMAWGAAALSGALRRKP